MSSELAYVSEILKALQSPTRQKLVVLLMTEKTRTLTTMARLTGMNLGLAFQSLQQLEKVGIVMRDRSRERHNTYKIRPANRSYIAAIYDNARRMNTGTGSELGGGHHCG